MEKGFSQRIGMSLIKMLNIVHANLLFAPKFCRLDDRQIMYGSKIFAGQGDVPQTVAEPPPSLK